MTGGRGSSPPQVGCGNWRQLAYVAHGQRVVHTLYRYDYCWESLSNGDATKGLRCRRPSRVWWGSRRRFW